MRIRSYQKDDEKEIMELDARELPSQWNRRTLDNWYWKFTDTNPAGHSFIWVAEHGGRLVGHFAAVPYRLKVFDDVLTASHTIGALVDGKFRNRGLLKFVGDKLLGELTANRIPYTWGFPNQAAHKFENVALGYNDLVNFDQWKLDKTHITATPQDPAIRPVERFDDGFQRLWERCSPGYAIAVERTPAYLNWRYKGRPDWTYYSFALYEPDNPTEPRGYIVLKLYREEDVLRGHIIDIFAARDDENTLTRLIDQGLNFFVKEKVDEVMIWIWGNPLIEDIFTRRGFVRETIDRPLIIRVNCDHKDKDRVVDKTHWYFTMGDSTEIF